MSSARPLSGARSQRPLHAWCCFLLVLVLSACGKSCGCGGDYLAELQKFEGEVQRDVAAAVGNWGGVANGERFRIGDGLRTGRSGSSQLELTGGGKAVVESNTVLRFLDRDPRGRQRLKLDEGVIRIDSSELDLDVHTPRAIATINSGDSVRIRSVDGETVFDVLVGTVAIEHGGQTDTLNAGQQLQLTNEQAAAAGADDAGTPSQDGQAGAQGTAADSVERAAANPAAPKTAPEVELALPEIDVMTLHAPALPVTFRVQPTACKAGERASAELDGRAASAEPSGGLVLQLTRPGAHRLNLRCDRRLARQTTIRVIRDAATLELPKSAQRVDVEADGRRYTVRYQNVIPVVSMHWGSAKPARSYTLVLKRGEREQTYKSSTPSRDLPGVELMEGNYDFWFSSDAGQKSSVGGLRIEFDNTARALSLSEPVEGATASSNEALVSGVALLRSQVSANGVSLPLDAKGRFRAQIPLNAEKSVLVRAIHPAAGVHYYLRRLR